MSLPEAGWELFIVPKSYYCVFDGSLYIVSAFVPPLPLAILELICTMWEFCYLFNRGNFLFQHYHGKLFSLFFQEGGLTTLLFSFFLFVFLSY